MLFKSSIVKYNIKIFQSNLDFTKVGQQQIHRKIEIKRKIETRYLGNFEFGHRTFQRKYSRLNVKSRYSQILIFEFYTMTSRFFASKFNIKFGFDVDKAVNS